MKKATIIMMCLLTLTSLFFSFSVKADEYNFDSNYARNCEYQNPDGVTIVILGVENNILYIQNKETNLVSDVSLDRINKEDPYRQGSCPAYYSNDGRIQFSNSDFNYNEANKNKMYTRIDLLSEVKKQYTCNYEIDGIPFSVKLDDERATAVLYKNNKVVAKGLPTKGNEYVLSSSEVRQKLINGECPMGLIPKEGKILEAFLKQITVGLVDPTIIFQNINSILFESDYFLTDSTDYQKLFNNTSVDEKDPITGSTTNKKPNDTSTSLKPTPGADNCHDVLDDNLVAFLQEIFDYMKFIAPILVILFGSLDFAKAVLAGDEKELKNATNRFIKRLIAAVALFFLPFILNAVLDAINKVDGTCGITYIWR